MRILLKPGKITRAEDRVVFETKDLRGRVELPLQAEEALVHIDRGHDLEVYLLEQHVRGRAIDYAALKAMLLGLYHGRCLKNQAELTPYIDSWSHPPLEEPTIFTPFMQVRPSQAERGDGMILFTLSTIVFGLFVLLAMPQHILPLSDMARFWTLMFLAPGAIATCNSLVLLVLSLMMNHRGAGVGARLSPVGFHYDMDSSFYRSYPNLSFFTAALLGFTTPMLAMRPVLPLAPSELAQALALSFFQWMSVAFFSVQLIPGLRNAWSLTRHELSKRGKLKGFGASSSLSGFYLGVSIVGLFVIFGIAPTRAIDAFRFAMSPTMYLHEVGVPGAAIILLGLAYAGFMLRDSFVGLSNMADDAILLKPLQEKFENLRLAFSTSRKERDRKEAKTILSEHSLFIGVPDEFKELLANEASIVECGAGSRLIRQDSNSTDLFILLSGSVGVYRRRNHGTESRLVVRLHAGAVFGEAGFFFGEKRTADVVVLDKARLLRIKRVRQMMSQSHTPKSHEQFRVKMWATQALSNSDIFRHLPNEALFQILNGSETVRVKRGEIIMREGEAADSLWICIQGSAKVTVQSQARPDIKMGDVMGEIGMIWNSKRTATIVAHEDSIFLKLQAVHVRGLFAHNLFLAATLQELGAQRLYRDQKLAA